MAAFAVALAAHANQLAVDGRTLRMNDLATVTVTLEGGFAETDFVEVPLQNLAFVGEPWVSSEFTWVNGVVTRRKVFRYRARPIAPGAARVGPVELKSEDGEVQRLNAIALTVAEDRVFASNDAEVVLRELQAAGREPFFIVAQTNKTSVYAGEPIVVTWVMFNAAPVQQWQVVSAPKLADFWSEELPRDEQPDRMYLGDTMVMGMAIRRVALFPLRSGRLRIEGMTAEAAMLKRTGRGPVSLFEGEMVDATFTSAPVDVEVKPLPEGAAVDAVGELTLTCDPPVQRGSGPVILRVALSGMGNVRSAVAPRFERGVNGTVQIEGGEVTRPRDNTSGEMLREWQYLIFPARSGTMEVPPLTMTIFAPSTATRRELRCAGTFLDVVAAQTTPSAGTPNAPAPPAEPREIPWPWLAGGAALLIALAAAIPRLVRELRLRREALEIVRDATPAEIRTALESRAKLDLREASDRGDAWRALRSLLDAADRERDIAVDADAEILRRVRELLRTLRT
ncbi:MAG TPA: BatD family protein [Thermoanaerobaculia bacterium]|nr:BatD family protein [Thermoanaerobaculia bacterium]